MATEDSFTGPVNVGNLGEFTMRDRAAGQCPAPDGLEESTLVPRVSLGGRSGVSIWAQDNHWRIQQQSWTNALGTASAVGSVLTNALTSRSFGLAASPTIRGS